MKEAICSVSAKNSYIKNWDKTPKAKS